MTDLQRHHSSPCFLVDNSDLKDVKPLTQGHTTGSNRAQIETQVYLTVGLTERRGGQEKEGRECLSTESTHLHDKAEKTICENVWFYLWKINSAYDFIIIPFLETLTPISVVKVWEAIKCLFFFLTSYYL